MLPLSVRLYSWMWRGVSVVDCQGSERMRAGEGHIMLMCAIECPANGGSAKCVRVDEVAALPLWLKLLLKCEK